VKGLAILAALIAALAVGLVSAGPPDLTNDAHNLRVQVLKYGGGYSSLMEFDECHEADGGVECTRVTELNAPAKGFKLYWCEDEECELLKRYDGDAWCNQEIKRGGRDATTPGCIWGTGHTYIVTAYLSVTGDVNLTYTSEYQITYLGTKDGVPQFGHDEGHYGLPTTNADCRALLREWREGGKIGPAPECRARRYYKEQDSPIVPID